MASTALRLAMARQDLVREAVPGQGPLVEQRRKVLWAFAELTATFWPDGRTSCVIVGPQDVADRLDGLTAADVAAELHLLRVTSLVTPYMDGTYAASLSLSRGWLSDQQGNRVL
jgi:hypothetical protein